MTPEKKVEDACVSDIREDLHRLVRELWWDAMIDEWDPDKEWNAGTLGEIGSILSDYAPDRCPKTEVVLGIRRRCELTEGHKGECEATISTTEL